MPSKYPILKVDDVIRRLKKKNFVFVSQRGSHAKYSDGTHVVIIPMHDEIQRGTLKSILTQAHMELDEFLQL